MVIKYQNLIEIKGGLSKKRVYRKSEKKINKILIDFSENHKDFYNFLNVFEILKKVNISIPKIYEVSTHQKIIIMEDFGNNTFDKIINKKNTYNLLKLAVDNIITIQNSIAYKDIIKLPKYSYNNLKNEITEFTDYYIPLKKIYNFSSSDFFITWKKVFKDNKFKFDSFVHRDFEFINLILIKKNNLHFKCGIIDFQNAIRGFNGWDLFSILENPRLNLTRNYNEKLIRYFYEKVNVKEDFKLFRNQYYLLNLARQTRILGRWAKLLNEGKKDYLKYISITKKRVESCLPNITNVKLKMFYEKALKINE